MKTRSSLEAAETGKTPRSHPFGEKRKQWIKLGLSRMLLNPDPSSPAAGAWEDLWLAGRLRRPRPPGQPAPQALAAGLGVSGFTQSPHSHSLTRLYDLILKCYPGVSEAAGILPEDGREARTSSWHSWSRLLGPGRQRQESWIWASVSMTLLGQRLARTVPTAASLQGSAQPRQDRPLSDSRKASQWFTQIENEDSGPPHGGHRGAVAVDPNEGHRVTMNVCEPGHSCCCGHLPRHTKAAGDTDQEVCGFAPGSSVPWS